MSVSPSKTAKNILKAEDMNNFLENKSTKKGEIQNMYLTFFIFKQCQTTYISNRYSI
jgi:hypothetical protein